ncbi:MAG: DUF4298 domain-containing protein [Comamonadaceae bacterium]|nr:DUF4298 domain-containing protein [Comamonadaceae bacterium]
MTTTAPPPGADPAATADPHAGMQARIDQAQRLYREWTQLLPRLHAAQADWQRGAEIMRALGHFYFDGDYMRCHTALEAGAPLRLDTPGEHSVMAEDTLWNAFHEQQTLAWQRLRAAIDVLDRPDSAPAPHEPGDA